MNRGDRAIAALREAADAIDACPLRRRNLFGGFVVPTETMRQEAEWIELQMSALREAIEDPDQPAPTEPEREPEPGPLNTAITVRGRLAQSVTDDGRTIIVDLAEMPSWVRPDTLVEVRFLEHVRSTATPLPSLGDEDLF